MDGKQIRIRKPANSEALYFNYKKYFSIVLLAMVDADLRFTYMEVGPESKCSDAALYNASELIYASEHKKCNQPADEPTLSHFILTTISTFRPFFWPWLMPI